MKGKDVVNALFKAMSGNTGKKMFEFFEIGARCLLRGSMSHLIMQGVLSLCLIEGWICL